MFELLALLERLKRQGSTKEDVLSAVNSVFASAVAPVPVAAPVSVVPKKSMLSLLDEYAPVESVTKPVVAEPVVVVPTAVTQPVVVQSNISVPAAPTIDFAKLSKARFGFAGQNKQDLFKSCVNGRLEDLPILNEAHCLKAWGMFKNWYRDYDCQGFEFERFLARGLALKEEVNCIEDLLDPKYDFSGVSNWSNLMIATSYTHEGWYANVARTAGFMPKTFVILIVDAQSLNQPRFIMSGEDHPRLKDEDRWQEGESMIYLPTAKIDLNRSFKHTCNKTQKETWFVKL